MPCDKMHDIIPFAQFEEAVDHAAQPPSRRPVQILAMKQLAAGDQHDSFADQSKTGLQSADREMQFAVGSELGCAKDFAQSFDFGLGRANDEHVVAQPDGVQLVAHFGDVAAESLDAFDAQLAFRFHRAAGHGRQP